MFQLIAKGKEVTHNLCIGPIEALDEIMERNDGVIWLGGECCQLDIM